MCAMMSGHDAESGLGPVNAVRHEGGDGMTGRKCSSCKHYEPAPIWRKGWCRNPLLYSPQQSHLVGEDDLDCERGMGNYWEAGDPSQAFAAVDVDSGGFRESVSDAFATISSTDDAAFIPPAALSSPRVYAVSGGSVGDPPDGEPPLSGAGGGRSGRDRPVGYYADDRYWTDYLRIAAPILGVLLMVGLFWFWASSFLGDNNNSAKKGGVAGTTTALPIISASPSKGTPTTGKGTPTLTIVKTPNAAVATATTPPDEGPAPTVDTGGVADTPATSAGGVGITSGATVIVAGTGGTGANMRTGASQSADIIAVVLDGTQLTTTGDSVDADGYTWGPVTGVDGDGFLVADFLELVQ